MKKIVIALITILILSSCGYETGHVETYHGIKVKHITEEGASNTYVIKEITYNGETHEYIEYHGNSWFGLAHWEGCKYCKEHANLR